MAKVTLTREEYKWYSGLYGTKTRRPFEVLLDGTGVCMLNPGGVHPLEVADGPHTLSVKFGNKEYAKFDFMAEAGTNLTAEATYPKYYGLAAFTALLAVFSIYVVADIKTNSRYFLLFALILAYQFGIGILQFRYLQFKQV